MIDSMISYRVLNKEDTVFSSRIWQKRVKDRFTSFINHSMGILIGNGLEAYWWDFKVNSGDLVTPLLLRHFGFTPIHTDRDHARLLCCGSILQQVSPQFSGAILGSGLLNDSVHPHFNQAQIYAVRGELTRQAIGAPIGIPLGDPGLLVTEVYRKRQVKKWRVGCVPHFSQRNHLVFRQLQSAYPGEIKIINVQRKPALVLKDIDRCEVILSSSLHGLVFADALGIPCAWISPEKELDGHARFKFEDYHSALQMQREPTLLKGNEDPALLIKQATFPRQENLMKVQADLKNAFLKFFRDQKKETAVMEKLLQ